jgi:hypothetical protein
MGGRSEKKVFTGEIERIKRRIHEKYRERIAAADFLEGIKLTCQMNEEIDEAIDELLEQGSDAE